MSNARLQQLQRTEDQVLAQIKEQKYYEALRLIVTIANRYIAMKLPLEALRFTYSSAVQILQQSEYNVGTESATQYLTLISKNNIPLDRDIITNILTLFSLLQTPVSTDEGFNTSTHFKFMHEALTITRAQIKAILAKIAELSLLEAPSKEDFNTLSNLRAYEAELHLTLGLFLFKYNVFSTGNTHMILASHNPISSTVPAQHALLIAPQLQQLMNSEQGSAVLRIVLMYLASAPSDQMSGKNGDQMGSEESLDFGIFAPAEAFLAAITPKIATAAQTQPCKSLLHCAENMIVAAKLGKPDFFKNLNELYSKLLENNSDQVIADLITHIGSKYCLIPSKKSFLDELFG